MINPTPTEAIPKPPICMSAATIACPIAVKLSAVSTTTSPVTQTALVDVNNAFKKDKCTPFFKENGIINSTAPTRITALKPSAMILLGLCFLFQIIFIIYFIIFLLVILLVLFLFSFVGFSLQSHNLPYDF